jgi:hypothetical protein
MQQKRFTQPPLGPLDQIPARSYTVVISQGELAEVIETSPRQARLESYIEYTDYDLAALGGADVETWIDARFEEDRDHVDITLVTDKGRVIAHRPRQATVTVEVNYDTEYWWDHIGAEQEAERAKIMAQEHAQDEQAAAARSADTHE